MDCFLVGTPTDRSQSLLSTLSARFGVSPAAVPTLSDLRADRRFAAAARPLVLVAQDMPARLSFDDLVGFAREANGRAFTVVIADTLPPDDYKRLVRTGSAEWVSWQDHGDELAEILARLDGPVAASRAAKALAFLPSKGGVGTTTLLAEVAVHLAARRKRHGGRIAILDLNLQGGTVADALDIEPRFDILEIVDRPERLDEHLVDIFTSPYSKTLDVFASPSRRIVPDAVQPDIVFTVIDAIASRYDAILFDLPAQPTSWTDNLLKGSDAVVAIGGESLPALRRLSATLDHLDTLAIPAARVAAVLNAVETDLLGRVARRALVDKALAKRRTFFVRRDDTRVSHAMDVGRPLLESAAASKISRDIRSVAGWLETIAVEPLRAPVPTSRSRGAAA